MTNQTSIAVLDAKISTLIEARREDLEDRKDDRERRDQERQEDRKMMQEMSGHMSDMAIALTEQTKNNEHIFQRIEKIEDTQSSHSKELKTISNVQSGNQVRWQVLAAGLVAFIAVGGLFLTAFLWVADKLLGGP
jgi:leucyl aminopeptidase (aminopeptidase T)